MIFGWRILRDEEGMGGLNTHVHVYKGDDDDGFVLLVRGEGQAKNAKCKCKCSCSYFDLPSGCFALVTCTPSCCSVLHMPLMISRWVAHVIT